MQSGNPRVGALKLSIAIAALVVFAVPGKSAEFQFSDTRVLAEVRTLKALPVEVVGLLGKVASGPQGIADVGEPFQGSDPAGSNLPARRLIVAGSSLSKVLATYEEERGSPSIHAAAFVNEAGGWRQVQEWTLRERPHGLSALITLTFPDSLQRTLPGQRPAGARPMRRDGPLRATNISDDEVRELQDIVRRVMPGAILNISGVVVGCPCEDGANCADQVWIVAHTAERTRGLELSRVGGRWTIGLVQQWWLDFEDLQARYKNFSSDQAFQVARAELLARFPVCTTDPRQAEQTAARKPPAH